MNQTNKDVLDSRLLMALQRDASRSVAELADEVGSSATSCWRRIRALEGVGILGSTVRIVDPKKAGRGLDVFCHVRMREHGPEARRGFERAIETVPAIVEVYAMSGDWDYLLHCLVGSIEEYQDILTHRILSCTSVANSSTIFALSRIKHTTVVPVD